MVEQVLAALKSVALVERPELAGEPKRLVARPPQAGVATMAARPQQLAALLEAKVARAARSAAREAIRRHRQDQRLGVVPGNLELPSGGNAVFATFATTPKKVFLASMGGNAE